MSNAKDETAERIAALERELAELKSAMAGKEDKPEPKKEFVPAPFQKYDPTANFTMPASALAEMVRVVPDNFMRDVVRDNRAPQNPGMIPDSQQPASPSPQPSATPGWIEPRPLGPQPGINLVDAQLIADDVRQRAELARKLK